MTIHYIHTYKTELDLTQEQKHKVVSSCGTCRFVYNLYLEENKKIYMAAVMEKEPDFYEKAEKFKAFNKGKPKEEKMSYPKAPRVKVKLIKSKDFYTWLKQTYIPKNPDKAWINETSSKSIRKAIDEAYGAYQKFFKGEAGYPRYKSRKNSNKSVYFVRPDVKQPVIVKRHCIKVPGYGLYHLKEKGYIPVFKEGEAEVSSGRLSEKNGRFYISVTVRFLNHKVAYPVLKEEGEGIDLGVKSLATLSDGTKYQNINKTRKMKKKAKRLKRLQKAQSRKYETYLKRQGQDEVLNKTIRRFNTGRPEKEQIPPIQTTKRNLDRNISRAAKLHESIARCRQDYNKKVAADIVSRMPRYITMEDLNIKGMMKNKHLSKAIADCAFYDLQSRIKALCFKNGIEFRLANRYYPSSKLCSNCGKKKNLKLSERKWECPECHTRHDRDLNAAENLKTTKDYVVIYPTMDANNIFI